MKHSVIRGIVTVIPDSGPAGLHPGYRDLLGVFLNVIDIRVWTVSVIQGVIPKLDQREQGRCCPITIYWNACNVIKENMYTGCNYTLDMNASHYKINRASPLPPGEGQGEGV